jgi:quinol monooxygenase YgiN
VSQLDIWTEIAVRPGKADQVREIAEAITAAVERDEPGMLRYSWFLDDSGTMCHVQETFVDTAAFLAHGGGKAVREWIPKLLAVASFTRLHIHGELSPEAEDVAAMLPSTLYRSAAGFSR